MSFTMKVKKQWWYIFFQIKSLELVLMIKSLVIAHVMLGHKSRIRHNK